MTNMLLKTIFTVGIFAVSISVHATPITIVDNGNYTTDELSGLDWLDLTETNALSYNYVNGQLGAGGAYEGWHFASSEQVVMLWSNFGIDLTAGSANAVYGPIDQGIIEAASLLGNTLCEYSCSGYPYGVLGHTGDYRSVSTIDRLGAFFSSAENRNVYNNDDGVAANDTWTYVHTGSFLIRDTVATVPEPSIVILLASGIIAFGVVRRKVRA